MNASCFDPSTTFYSIILNWEFNNKDTENRIKKKAENKELASGDVVSKKEKEEEEEEVTFIKISRPLKRRRRQQEILKESNGALQIELKKKRQPLKQQEQQQQQQQFAIELLRTQQFHRDAMKASELSKTLVFESTDEYRNYFTKLLFSDLSARISNLISEGMAQKNKVIGILPVQWYGISHTTMSSYNFRCLFQIHNSSDFNLKKNKKNIKKNNKNNNYLNKNDLVLIVYSPSSTPLLSSSSSSSSSSSDLVMISNSHFLGLIDRVSKDGIHFEVKFEIQNQQRIESFKKIFPLNLNDTATTDQNKNIISDFEKKNLHNNNNNNNENYQVQLILLENIQNRMREFRAICSIDNLELKEVIINCKKKKEVEEVEAKKNSQNRTKEKKKKKKKKLLQSNNNNNNNNNLWIWQSFPEKLKQRMSRYLNESQCLAVEQACQLKGITLLKGPPGCGKTRTVIYLLNGIHIARTNAMYESWIRRIFNNFVKRIENSQNTLEKKNAEFDHTASYTFDKVLNDITDISLFNNLNSSSSSSSSLQPILRKPRLLVCAPSNAAVDEIIMRIVIQQGFIDGNLVQYRPPIIRIGRIEKFREAVGQQLSLSSKIQAFMDRLVPTLTETEIKSLQLTHLNQKELGRFQIKQRMRIVQNDRLKTEKQLQKVVYSQLLNLKNHMIEFEPFKRQEGVKNIIHLVTLLNQHRLEFQRLKWVHDLSEDNAREMLSESLLEEAELVFVTLNSSGGHELRHLHKKYKRRRGFSNSNSKNLKLRNTREHSRFFLDPNFEIKNRLFDHCIIDEAGQCTEPDILIPLQYDIESVVLVGDPQQLPATVFATGPSAWLYERSLFERLHCGGYPVHLLNTQYRMHPEIALFPNQHFYGNMLKNGDNVVNSDQYNPKYHSVSNDLKPFMFFNLKKSREDRHGTSLLNLNEAKFVVSIIERFFTEFKSDAIESELGIITPYKKQEFQIKRQIRKSAILQSIKHEYNRNLNIEVATVDFFQGREKDVVIFSCVRARGGGGIGFLSDIRRMNVAITRAKYSLWIIGNERGLVRNDDWKALIDNAKKRNAYRVVEDNGNVLTFDTVMSDNKGARNVRDVRDVRDMRDVRDVRDVKMRTKKKGTETVKKWKKGSRSPMNVDRATIDYGLDREETARETEKRNEGIRERDRGRGRGGGYSYIKHRKWKFTNQRNPLSSNSKVTNKFAQKQDDSPFDD